MEVPYRYTHIKPKCQICFRNLKNIDPDILIGDLQHLLSTHTSSVSQLVDFYNNTLGSILDVHAPVKVKTVHFSHSASWFPSELRRIKSAGRALEWWYKASGLTVHKLAYQDYQ